MFGEPRGRAVRAARSGSPVSCRKSTSVIPQVSTVCPVRTRTPGLRSAHGAIASPPAPPGRRAQRGGPSEGEAAQLPGDWLIQEVGGVRFGQGGCLLGGSRGRVGPRANRCLERLRAGPARAQPVAGRPGPRPARQVRFPSPRPPQPHSLAHACRSPEPPRPGAWSAGCRVVPGSEVMTEASPKAPRRQSHLLAIPCQGVRTGLHRSGVLSGSGYGRPDLGQSREHLHGPFLSV